MWYRTLVTYIVSVIAGAGYVLSLLKRTITPEAYEIQIAEMKNQFKEDIHILWNGTDEEEEEENEEHKS